MMKRLTMVLAAAVALTGIAETVTNVRGVQRQDSDLVDIYYDLNATDGGTYTVDVTLEGKTESVPESSLTGDVGEGVSPGKNRHIIWDAGADWRNRKGQVKTVVTTTKDVSQYGARSQYMVIDLSGGKDAGKYPISYIDNAPTNGWNNEYKTTKIILRKIPAGSFIMGSPEDEIGRADNENQHLVRISRSFYIGVFPITQRQYELVMGNRPSYYSNSSYYAMRPVEQVSWNSIRGNSSTNNWPLSKNVDPLSFMGILRKKTGIATFDLPTESQWEYACRAGSTTSLNSGRNISIPRTPQQQEDLYMNEVGRYLYNGGSVSPSNCTTANGTAKVGSYEPNSWGLYDMHGNVYEWCLDWYGSYPLSATDPSGAISGTSRVSRGGSTASFAYHCRSAARYSQPPAEYASYIGFRLCCHRVK